MARVRTRAMAKVRTSARSRTRTSLELGLGLVKVSCVINKWFKQNAPVMCRNEHGF